MRDLAWGLGLGALLAIAWMAYRPGLSGGFIFDDYANLPLIGANGTIDNSTAFLRYISSGSADPTGRPIAMASFLIDANDWPADPEPFKRTSILLHLLNGTLLFWVLLLLGRTFPLPESVARNAALLGAGIWLLHPLLVSTTLYVVQREAMLPATFVLAAFVGWVKARNALARGHASRALVGMAAAAVGGTLLAVLSKANGVLLPLLLLAGEATVLRLQAFPTPSLAKIHRRASALLLVLPSLLLAGWMLSQIPFSIQSAKDIRDWTMGQRLLTEPRALIDYFGLWFLPRTNSSGVFNDAFAASRDWLHPWTTLPCIGIVLGLIALAFAWRRRHPAIAFGILFFFTAHLMESTFLPLELYFEHRNYLPMLMLSWPIAIALVQPGSWTRSRRATAVGVVVLLGLLTCDRATIWGDPYHQALGWARQNPDSVRAQTNGAQYLLSHGHPVLAALRLRNELAKHPQAAMISVNLVATECRFGFTRPESIAAVRYGLARTRTEVEQGLQWLKDAIGIAHDGSCSGLDFAAVESLVRAARSNTQWQNLPSRRQDLDHIEGMLALSEGDAQRALRLFNAALAEEPKPEGVLQHAALLGSAGHPDLALEHLHRFDVASIVDPAFNGMPSLHDWLLHRQHYWEGEISRLQATLQADLDNKNAHMPAGAP